MKIPKVLLSLFLILTVFCFIGCDLFNSGDPGSSDTDSDGDGYSDYDEINLYNFDESTNPLKFNPYIADIPKLVIEMNSVPSVEVHTTYNGETSTSISATCSSTSEDSLTESKSSSSASSLTRTLGVSVTGTKNFGISSGVASGSVSVEVSGGWEWYQETSNSYGADVASSYSEYYEEAEEKSETEGYSLDGGEIKVSVDIKNDGNISFTLEDITLSAIKVYPNNSGNYVMALATLEYDGSSGFPSTTIAPGETKNNCVFSGELSTDEALGLLSDMTNLTIQVSTYEVVDANGVAFAHNMTLIDASTSTINIDYGIYSSYAPKQFKVSNNFSDGDTVTLKSILDDVLKIAYTEGESNFNDTTQTGLTSIQGNSCTDSGFWMICHSYYDSSSASDEVSQIYTPLASYTLDDIEVDLGDTVSMVFVEDKDFDGLTDREEFAYGTDDEDIDTDDDGTSDYDEIQNGTDPRSDGSDEEDDVTSVNNVSSFSSIPSNGKNYMEWVLPSDAYRAVLVRSESDLSHFSLEYGDSVDIGEKSLHGTLVNILYVGDGSSANDPITPPHNYYYKLFVQNSHNYFSSGVTRYIKYPIKVTVKLQDIIGERLRDGDYDGGSVELTWNIALLSPRTGEWVTIERAAVADSSYAVVPEKAERSSFSPTYFNKGASYTFDLYRGEQFAFTINSVAELDRSIGDSDDDEPGYYGSAYNYYVTYSADNYASWEKTYNIIFDDKKGDDVGNCVLTFVMDFACSN